MSRAPDDPRALASRVAQRDPAAVARAISIVEDRRIESRARVIELLAALRAQRGAEECHRVGITGPPGVGKSSLVSAVARETRSSGRSVGVLAVDPSSPRSGGALLGDRARIEIDPADDELFVRSMASGGYLGGLARAAQAALEILSSAFDLVIAETTGVGQSETDVEHVADTVVLVIQPGSGDVLQFLKAGILEIPDVFVVNKADLGEIAERAGAELQAALGTVYGGSGRAPPPVVFTSVTERRGIGELLGVLDGHRAGLVERGELRARRRRAASAWAYGLYLKRYGEVGVERLGGKDAALARLAEIVGDGRSPIEAVAELADD